MAARLPQSGGSFQPGLLLGTLQTQGWKGSNDQKQLQSPLRAQKEIVGGLERDKALPKGFRVSQGLSAKGFLDTASRKSPYTPPWPHTVHVFLNAPCSLLSSGVPG